MSFYSVGKNEIRSLLEKEAHMKDELKVLMSNAGTNVRSFKAIALNSELEKLRNRLKVLTLGNDNGGDDIA